ncbi:nucleolar pre-ribosomal-associated protein 1-like isoform X2 [Vidua chalybeata]|uniref:nucleolar pre-ribosomal-associated protein 1-like isoform X2 n=1 Tax=Vidua chalybeata TaxID=81927 RepID=UPI0023A8C547|nr:nucleolar pre-ribosomal-associated protein 1-like isoform X2 [Vidua chalybeata]
MFGLQTDCSQWMLAIKFGRNGNGEVQKKLCTKQHEWILRFLGEGLRDKHCCELYVYQRIFRVILSLLSSPLCDQGSQSPILEIRQSAARVTSRAAHEPIEDHSLLSWVLHGLEKRFLENKVINKMISLLHPLWLINLGDKRENRNRSQMLLLRWIYDLPVYRYMRISVHLCSANNGSFYDTLLYCLIFLIKCDFKLLGITFYSAYWLK